MRRNWIMLVLIVIVVLLIDQGTKRRVINTIELHETVEPIPALTPYFQITRSENTGSAFGFLPQAGDLFLVIAVVVVAAMFYFYPRIPANGNLTRLGVAFICGGALGNALDRLTYGLVIDFIHYRIPGLISNVSNLADHAIVLGVILVFIDSWRLDRLEKQAALETEDESSPG